MSNYRALLAEGPAPPMALHWRRANGAGRGVGSCTRTATRLASKCAPLAIAVAVLGALAAIGYLGWWRATGPADRPLTRLSVDLGPDAVSGLNLTIAISPDGQRIVFPVRGRNGTQQLATRLLDKDEAAVLPGTENGRDPFFSPDGGWIGFFANNQIYKVSVMGGAPTPLGPTNAAPEGASWGADGNIVGAFSNLTALSRIPSAGGRPQPLTKLAPGENTHRWPQVLPGGTVVLFTASGTATTMAAANIEAISLKTGQRKILVRGGYYGRYLPSGHLVYVREGRLYGVRFDLLRLEIQGEPAPVLEDVAANPLTGGGRFDFSSLGTFVYAAGKGPAQKSQLVWLDKSGNVEPLLAAPQLYAYPRLSPDGRKIAFIGVGGDLDVYDIGRGRTMRLTLPDTQGQPVWTPDGRHLVRQLSNSGFSWARSDGSGEPEKLVAGSGKMKVPASFSPDGRRLAYIDKASDTGFDIWTLPLDLTDPDHPKPGEPEVFLRTAADELGPSFSPDGRWIAYRSIDERGNSEIWVRPFPDASGGHWQVSTSGGLVALWSKNSRELFYESADNRIMVVDYSVEGSTFIPGKPRVWSDRQLFYLGLSNLDLAPNGKRFAVLDVASSKDSPRVVFLFNFFDELRRRIPPEGK